MYVGILWYDANYDLCAYSRYPQNYVKFCLDLPKIIVLLSPAQQPLSFLFPKIAMQNPQVSKTISYIKHAVSLHFLKPNNINKTQHNFSLTSFRRYSKLFSSPQSTWLVQPSASAIVQSRGRKERGSRFNLRVHKHALWAGPSLMDELTTYYTVLCEHH